MINQKRLIAEFMELVQVDSQTKQEQAISAVLKQKFAGLGLTWAEDDAASITGHGAGNLIVTFPASEGVQAEKIFFTSHMDTVAPGNGIKPQLDEDGYIRSDGTTILGADDKAGIAAMLEAIRVLQEQSIPHGQIQLVITVGEESGLVGAQALDVSKLDAAFGYAIDSNGSIGDIAVAAPTQAKVDIEIFGKSAHAGVNPQDGISAFEVAAAAIAAMPLGRVDEETTANIGKIEGGGATNVVCDYVKIVAEARSLVQHKLDSQVEAMRQAVKEAADRFGARGEVHARTAYPAYQYEDSDRVVQFAKRAITSIGLTPRTFRSGGGSDANIFNGFGVPTVNLSVGYENIHTTKEQIKAADLAKLAELVLAIIKQAAVQ
ncbi:M20/M25/M40 family metallo-hydrolase [Paenibacillus protaetiae]|uniref:M20/M25/M40 family metallo-hydrolase n=1 Tax=Paenibacillus protaetiae TaxID=2509456 RepID=A0A4P6EUQ9_9BACL|nr:M20/M25/M40 family metallo-hydrolase [Paenibacillus protaetiae]QAY66225.1 M20/M25/M40 family metallo-hydrolase [Paenibacillus protaetiae]